MFSIISNDNFCFFLGTQNHECCVFVQKDENGFQIIHFNPNFDAQIKIFKELMDEMKVKTKLRGYEYKLGNIKGLCTLYSWKQMIYMLVGRVNPFDYDAPFVYCKTAKKFLEQSKNV